jgi:integrase
LFRFILDISDFFEYAKGFAKDDFIFKTFPFNADNGRAAWLIGMFPRFLREDAKIIEPTKRLTLYGLRHSFITAMRNAKVPEDIRTAIVGHKKGQHARYGSTDIKILAEAIASTKPLG